MLTMFLMLPMVVKADKKPVTVEFNSDTVGVGGTIKFTVSLFYNSFSGVITYDEEVLSYESIDYQCTTDLCGYEAARSTVTKTGKGTLKLVDKKNSTYGSYVQLVFKVKAVPKNGTESTIKLTADGSE